MSKRNIILLFILLLILALVAIVSRAPKLEIDTDSGNSGNNFFSNFFRLPGQGNKNPSGNGKTPSGADVIDNEYVETEMLSLRKVSSMPVAGFGVFNKEIYTYVTPPEKPAGVPESEDKATPKTEPVAPETELQTTVRYVDKSNGNIYQSEAGKVDERKFSEIIMPGIHEAFFGKKGSSVILRYLQPNTETIETFVREFPEEVVGADVSAEGEVTGSFLPQNIVDVSVSGDGGSMFYISNIKSVAYGVVANASGASKTQVFTSPYTEWLTQWPNKNLITVTTKPAAGIPGYAYGINPNMKDFRKILGDVNGLTTLVSPDGKFVLYGDDQLKLSLLNRETGDLKNLNLKTLPEKCVWGFDSAVIFCGAPQFIPFGSYPDTWYKGEISFSDSIWQLSVANSEATQMIVDPIKEVKEGLDLVRPALSEDGKYLFFLNKKSPYLWELRLK